MRKKIRNLLTTLPLTAMATNGESVATPSKEPAPFLRHEISGDTSANFGGLTSLWGSSDRYYSFYGSGGYAFALDRNWQLGSTLSLYISNRGTQGGILLVGPTYNFGGDGNLLNSAFVSLQAGVGHFRWNGDGTSDSETHFEAVLSVGKRWAITDSVSYKPYVSAAFTKYPEDHAADLKIVPLSFSIGF